MDITAEIIAQFRYRFPEFADVATWPDANVRSALERADYETSGRRFGIYEDNTRNKKQRMMFLFAAHVLVTTYGPLGVTGTVNSGASFPTASKSVGDESVSYSLGGVSSLSAGDSWFALSAYGLEYLRIRSRMIGAIAV